MKWAQSTAIAMVLCGVMGVGTAVFGEASVQTASGVPNTLISFTESVLAKLAQTPSIVQLVETQNARRVGTAELKSLDAKWTASQAVESYMWELMRNRLAWELVNFQYQHKFIVEAFAMNSRGAIIAETNRTSTYYKGEAEKFTAAYAGGAGGAWYGPVEFDASTAEMVIQVSVPVMKGARAIGVICFGVSLDRWEERR